MNDSSSLSFWHETASTIDLTPIEADINVDFLIVGGGFTGLSTAYHLKLAEPTAKIALVEENYIGFGASGRNAGFNMTLFGLNLTTTLFRFGKQRTKEAHLYMEKAVDTTQELIQNLNFDCDYEHPGFFRVATSQRYKKRILKELDVAQKLDLKNIHWLEADKLSQYIQGDNYLGAWWEPRCGLLNPYKLCLAWKKKLLELGVEVFEHSKVQKLQSGASHVNITLESNHSIKAKKVVLATNAYTKFFKGLKYAQVPVWTHIVLTQTLSEKQLHDIGWQQRQGIEDARNLVHYYRLTKDNRILIGGSDVTLNFGKDANWSQFDRNQNIFRKLKKSMIEIFPTLKGIEFTHAWGGPVSITLDMAPKIGYLGNENIIYSIGCMGHGVSMTHLNGKTITDLVLENHSELTSVFFVNRRALSLPPEPLSSITASAIKGYLSLEDRFLEKY